MVKISCKSHLKNYCSCCTFAGIHFIADDSRHWTERLLWLVLVILSWYGSALLIIAAWDAFITNPISFGVETTYTDWDTKLPAVAICEANNKFMVYNVSDTIWTPDHLLDLEDALKDVAYFRGSCYRLIDVCYKNNYPDPFCKTSNYSYYAQLVRSDCRHILSNCSYNDNSFDCCSHFQPIHTDMGTCFIINSIQTKKTDAYKMIINMKQKKAVLRFDVLLNSMLYTIGEDEVPSITSSQYSTLKMKLGHGYQRQVVVRNIENDPQVVETTPEQRACRFHYENENGLYPHYSYSACAVQCRKQAQRDLCGCNDHFMLSTSTSEHCNISGMICLHSHVSQLTTLKPPWAVGRHGMTCNCLPSCNETEITIIKDVVISHKNNKKKIFVEIVLAYLPTERFKRNVVRSRLDLVVSVGGTTGLFVGASLLSFVELIFYFTARFVGNIWIVRRKTKKEISIAKYDKPSKSFRDFKRMKRRNNIIHNTITPHTFKRDPVILRDPEPRHVLDFPDDATTIRQPTFRHSIINRSRRKRGLIVDYREDHKVATAQANVPSWGLRALSLQERSPKRSKNLAASQSGKIVVHSEPSRGSPESLSTSLL
ncbi:sodium channel protein Nach [Battus philenor]|uniref:sodium channel protein Nach n=1 Tax=Battus philenor TaxID=42288 RepID=UPI0035CF4F12